MEWFRRSQQPTLQEHLEEIRKIEDRILKLQLKLRDEEVTSDTLDQLSDAYEEYLRVSTQEVGQDNRRPVAV